MVGIDSGQNQVFVALPDIVLLLPAVTRNGKVVTGAVLVTVVTLAPVPAAGGITLYKGSVHKVFMGQDFFKEPGSFLLQIFDLFRLVICFVFHSKDDSIKFIATQSKINILFVKLLSKLWIKMLQFGVECKNIYIFMLFY
jgi:hypothetical protein